MTAQTSDKIEYRGELFNIAGVSGHGLFNPQDHGLTPVPMSSACWRGYICRYAIDEDELYLSSLNIYLGRAERLRIKYNRNAPTLFGVAPQAPTDNEDVQWFGPAVFEDLHYRLPYNGGLLIAQDFIQALYVHMGFHPAWKYQVVHELAFRDGNLIGEIDRSQQVSEFRDAMTADNLKPSPHAGRKEVMSWIAKCFTQNYRFVPET